MVRKKSMQTQCPFKSVDYDLSKLGADSYPVKLKARGPNVVHGVLRFGLQDSGEFRPVWPGTTVPVVARSS